MTIPRFDDVREHPLTTDEDVLQRTAALLDGTAASRRQVWLMFLDAEQRQLPELMPSWLPPTPNGEHRAQFVDFLEAIVDELRAASVIVVYERRGPIELSDADRAWLRMFRAACLELAVPLRGPLLLHSGGVRWIAPEECVESAANP